MLYNKAGKLRDARKCIHEGEPLYCRYKYYMRSPGGLSAGAFAFLDKQFVQGVDLSVD